MSGVGMGWREIGVLSYVESFPTSTDWPRSWRGRPEGCPSGDAAGGCGSGLRDCLAAL